MPKPVSHDRGTLVAAGTGVSTLWFMHTLRELGLRLRFAPA
jgi:hypothetical protein